ncbi:helix-turn-helix domain-containing protein [Fodinicola acaciae]|uniref:AraC-like ligand-binding domain-containing protein n=1 Tax=Fodinicola acaciae TaxID=2681555 RepID=UPI001C9E7C63|nr:helix-turn-helix domain-containing protein [Fodinicola acaciae]
MTVPQQALVTRDFAEFRAAVSQSFVPLQASPGHGERFHGRLRMCGADEVGFCEIAASPHVVQRTPELIARSDRPRYKVSQILAGTGLLTQDGRDAVLGPGDFALYDTNRPYSLVFEESFRSLVLIFPQRLIDLPRDLVGQLTAVRMSGHTGTGGVVGPYLAQLGGNLQLLGSPVGLRLERNTVDLLTTMLVAELGVDLANADPHRDLMRRIHDYIDANLSSPDLGPAQIAAEHYISTRHLHGLFREQGTTVAGWVRQRRLERCRRDLRDPLLAARPVAAIAARWGFIDAAHFSRIFRAAYDQSPSELRGRG